MNERRARYLLVVFGILFITLVGYLTYFEVNQTEKYTKAPENARNYKRDIEIIRGSIYDCNGEILAYSKKQTVPAKDSSSQDIEEIVRIYPFDDLYTGVVGYVTKDYSSRTQIEREYNDTLLDTSLADKITEGEARGKDISLTLDHKIQQVAYDALADNFGAVVAMNPKTGEIYALVSKPSQNANKIVLEEDDKTSSLFSRPLDFAYPPGSTYKIITAAAILEEGLEDYEYNDVDGEYLDVPNANGGLGYGKTDLYTGFTVSSNAYFGYMSAEKLGQKKVQDIAKRFLLNTDLNEVFKFDLPIKKATFQQDYMNPGDIVNSSIGQGQTAMTPLHLALVGATVANDGVMPNPQIVYSVDGVKIKHDTPGKQIISKSVAEELKELMSYVTSGYKNYNGTGSKASLSEYDIQVCGKTGTSETGTDEKDNAVYVGFAPYEDPEIVVAVIIENIGFGGTYAAPVAKKVMMQYFGLE